MAVEEKSLKEKITFRYHSRHDLYRQNKMLKM